MSLLPTIVVHNASPVDGLLKFGDWGCWVAIPAGATMATPYNDPTATIWLAAVLHSDSARASPLVLAEIYPQTNIWQSTPAFDQRFHRHTATVRSLLHPNTFAFQFQAAEPLPWAVAF